MARLLDLPPRAGRARTARGGGHKRSAGSLRSPGARGSDGADHGGSHPRTRRLGPPSWISGTLDPEESEDDRDRTVAPGRPGRPAGRPARAGGPSTPCGPGVGTRQRNGEGPPPRAAGSKAGAPGRQVPARPRTGSPPAAGDPRPAVPPPRTYAAGGPGPEREPTAWRAAGRSSLCDRSPYSEPALPTRGRAGTLLRMLGAVRAGNPLRARSSDFRNSAGGGAGGGRRDPCGATAPTPGGPLRPGDQAPAGTSVENYRSWTRAPSAHRASLLRALSAQPWALGREGGAAAGSPGLPAGAAPGAERSGPAQSGGRSSDIPLPSVERRARTSLSHPGGPAARGPQREPKLWSGSTNSFPSESLSLDSAENRLGPRWAPAAPRKAEVAGANAGQSRGPTPGKPRSSFQASQPPRGPGSVRDRRGSRLGPCRAQPRPPGQELSGEVPAGGGAAVASQSTSAGERREVAPEAGRQR
ncbi:collagen alpha-1(I) chain-like [Lontra canadensis]|uniref:collagen alpha-1(I) chain-like n=1 Tax=Lontra canadensis TaxID=76717 RepID=UPI0013F3889F|nr:collagen alpha-1(I) chain-like [Lontra canadensis]